MSAALYKELFLASLLSLAVNRALVGEAFKTKSTPQKICSYKIFWQSYLSDKIRMAGEDTSTGGQFGQIAYYSDREDLEFEFSTVGSNCVNASDAVGSLIEAEAKSCWDTFGLPVHGLRRKDAPDKIVGAANCCNSKAIIVRMDPPVCEFPCTTPTALEYDFTLEAGNITMSGVSSLAGVTCAAGYTGSVVYGACTTDGGDYTVSGCQACSNSVCGTDQYRTGQCTATSDGYQCMTCSNVNCAGNEIRTGTCQGESNGYQCSPNPCTQNVCGSNSDCSLTGVGAEYRCACKSGYSGPSNRCIEKRCMGGSCGSDLTGTYKSDGTSWSKENAGTCGAHINYPGWAKSAYVACMGGDLTYAATKSGSYRNPPMGAYGSCTLRPGACR